MRYTVKSFLKAVEGYTLADAGKLFGLTGDGVRKKKEACEKGRDIRVCYSGKDPVWRVTIDYKQIKSGNYPPPEVKIR